MKKTLLSLAVASASVGLSLSAHAAMSADLTVKGQITPPACDLSFTDATVDFGTRAFGSLNIGGTILPTQTTTLNIQCAGATRVSVSAADNRPGSAIAAGDVTAWPNLGTSWAKTIWGLGTTGTADAKIGGLEVAVDSAGARVDGNPVSGDIRILGAALGTEVWDNGIFANLKGYIDANRHYAFGPANSPAAVSNVSMPLQLSAVIARPATLPADDAITLDGSLTFSLHYL